MNEIWRDVKGYKGIYKVSNLGNIKSLDRLSGVRKLKGKLMKLSKDKDGYKQLSLTMNGVREVKPVHKIVAMAFLNHKPCGVKEVVDHINEDKTDNRVCNLQLLTVRENTSKSIKNKTSKYIGVSWFNKSNKWRASIYINGKTKHLGLFTNELEASQTYQRYLESL